jgi:hypothetical protein
MPLGTSTWMCRMRMEKRRQDYLNSINQIRSDAEGEAPGSRLRLGQQWMPQACLCK